MERIKKLFFKTSDINSNETAGDRLASNHENKSQTEEIASEAPQQMPSQSDAASLVDPKVTQFFQEFPEPYRQKLIERYSSKEGIYRFDIIRAMNRVIVQRQYGELNKMDIAMEREYDYAKRGILLEEKREQAEYERLRELDEVEKKMKEYRESRQNREMAEWEKSIKTVIPLQQDELMGMKLFQAANMSLLGLLLPVAAIRVKKTQPLISQFRYLFGVVGSLNLCALCQTAAVYRLMDWGLFDRTHDDRDFFIKAVDELKMSLMPDENAKNINKPDT